MIKLPLRTSHEKPTKKKNLFQMKWEFSRFSYKIIFLFLKKKTLLSGLFFSIFFFFLFSADRKLLQKKYIIIFHVISKNTFLSGYESDQSPAGFKYGPLCYDYINETYRKPIAFDWKNPSYVILKCSLFIFVQTEKNVVIFGFCKMESIYPKIWFW